MVNQTVISCHHFSEHEEYGNQGWLKVARCSNQAEIHQIPRGVLLLYRDERRSVLSALSWFPHWNGLFLGIPHFLTGPFGATLGIAKKHIPIDFHILKGCGEPPPSSQFSGFFLIWFKMIRKNCRKRISLINFSPPKIGVNFDQFSLRAGRVVSRRPWNHWGFSKSCPFIPPKMMDLEEVSVDGRASTELLSDCWFAGGVNMSV